ncbi:MAG: hypothetical protein A3K19_01465 [Lentisphaerae bacterium RIFOXYB12_FULL_65_16]|nr:MAG: hypothetical protein A3K18_22820 [Lentisphaerae bacterium RIFOXYA12_64_32]OGV92809.1 MAG: hypothetical protein A3K19_01465 [Lentisphaerae bacterium RIFOXYB12_FULL_65_16]
MKKEWWVGVVAAALLFGGAAGAMAQAAPEEGGPFRKQKEHGQERGSPANLEMGKRFPMLKEFMEDFKAENPEEFDRLMQLRETDKDAFNAEIRKIMMERRKDGKGGGMAPPMQGVLKSPEEEKCMELGRQYREAQAPEEKERIKADLAESVKAAFDKRLEGQKQRLADLEKEMARIKDAIGKREANRAAVCNQRIDELTRSPELNW